MFESSDRVGGRLHVITMEGQTVESGGTIIHSSNKYMMDFVKELGKLFPYGINILLQSCPDERKFQI